MAQRQWRSDDTDTWNEAFGDGSDGSTYVVPSNEGCSGTSGTTSLTLASAGSFSNDDLVLIHQTRGTGVGTWELNKISSGGGTTSLTMAYDLTNTYTDSGSSQAQIIEMKQYDSVNPGTISAPTWNGSDGGIIAYFDKGTTTISGTLTLTGKGFDGGNGGVYTTNPSPGRQGEGTSGAGGGSSVSPNGSGGGGGSTYTSPTGWGGAGGGGGGNSASGTIGSSNASFLSTRGQGGNSSGNASLTSFTPGGSGGGGGADSSAGDGRGSGGAGGYGGGMLAIFANDIVVTGTINLGGANGANATTAEGPYPHTGGGGGGAGGSCLLKCATATLGTTKITAPAGSAGSGGGYGYSGGAGSVGRIHIDYSDSYTGTTSPTLDATNDTTITGAVATTNYLEYYRRTRIPGLIHGVIPE